ncbi:MAG: PIN domain-containing protein [Aequorivita vladivostokensis]|nr:PIN domain-containing protein [Aequorivita vladivostokensis]
MLYLLDTNICIHFFRGKFNLLKKIETVKLQNCAISEITLAELVFEAENSSNPQMNNELIVQFTEHLNILPLLNAIDFYAKEKVFLMRKVIL